jgi:MoxR-like ATPase
MAATKDRRRKPAAAKKGATAAPDTFLALEAELCSIALEREDEVRSLILALLSRQHLFLLGVPGTGKSMLAKQIAKRLTGSRHFSLLLSRFTTPEEVFGPPSLKALRERDVLRRNGDGMLQQSEVAFLDEIWKSNSAVLNTLLPLLNEREYHEGGTVTPAPLETMICASNELPQGEDLGALYDRILFRHVVRPLSDSGLRSLLLSPPDTTPKVTVTAPELREAQAQCAAVRVGEATIDTLMRIRAKLEGVKGVYVSTRSWAQALGAVRAQAWLAGRTETEDTDLLILTHCLWGDPDHRSAVEVAVIDCAAPALRELRDLLDLAHEMAANFKGTDDENLRVEAFMKLKGAAVKATDKAAEIGDSGEVYAEKIRVLYEAARAENLRRTADRYGMTDLFEEVE